jgi:hypothetical protein
MPETGAVLPAGYMPVTFDYRGDGEKGCAGFVEDPALIEYASGRMVRLPVLTLEGGQPPVIWFIDADKIENLKAYPVGGHLTLMTSWNEDEPADPAPPDELLERMERLTPTDEKG